MSTETSAVSDADRRRFQELAEAGAERAATAFGQLVDRPIRVRASTVQAAGAPSAAHAGVAQEWSTGVFFELEGCLDALVAVMFRSAARDAIVECMLGEEPKELADWCIESALTEVANILVSHVASGIADAMGDRLIPSVPAISMDHAECLLADQIAARGDGPRVECELADAEGELGGLVVVVGRPGDA